MTELKRKQIIKITRAHSEFCEEMIKAHGTIVRIAAIDYPTFRFICPSDKSDFSMWSYKLDDGDFEYEVIK